MAIPHMPDEAPLDPTPQPDYGPGKGPDVVDPMEPEPGPDVNDPAPGISRLAPLGELACSGAYLPLLNV